MVSIEVIKKDLEKSLSEYRFGHSLRVAEVSRELANIYHYDPERAYLVGLLHDVAKEFTEEENLDILKRHHVFLSSEDLCNSKVVHADVGALVAKERYGLDEELCHAIFSHTLGDIPMNLLDKILFVADKIEPGKNYDGILKEREMAFVDLDQALIFCIENNHKKLIRQNKNVHERSIEVLNYLKESTCHIKRNSGR